MCDVRAPSWTLNGVKQQSGLSPSVHLLSLVQVLSKHGYADHTNMWHFLEFHPRIFLIQPALKQHPHFSVTIQQRKTIQKWHIPLISDRLGAKPGQMRERWLRNRQQLVVSSASVEVAELGRKMQLTFSDSGPLGNERACSQGSKTA